MSTLRILTPGLGAVTTTTIAGIELARRGLAAPVGALTEYADLDGEPVSDFVTPLQHLEFGAWDPVGADGLAAAREAGVLSPEHLDAVANTLAAVQPMPAVYDPSWVRLLADQPHVKSGTWMEQAEELIAEIQAFLATGERAVMVWCGSTEAYRPPSQVHATIEDFERGLKAHDENIAPSQVYAYAALCAGIPFANGAPNVTVDTPALTELAVRNGVPIAGKDFKTGQTLLKTILAPGLRARRLGLHGWFSTNILGNRDGLVLDDPDSFRSKEITKLGVLHDLLEPERHPDLYGDMDHQIRINYYRPRGDEKEGWDAIDLFGWLGYDMQIKVNFQCRDSILAAPVVLDLARLLDWAQRAGHSGVQDWLGFYLKSPMPGSDGRIEHDLFKQERRLYETMEAMAARTGPLA